MKNRLLLALLTSVTCSMRPLRLGLNWGPNGARTAEDARPPIRFGPGTNLLWKTALPPGHSSPVVWADRIFLTAFDGEIKKLETLCLDRRTGKVLWRAGSSPRRGIREGQPD